uniref:Protein arginine N-methyltransferase n=1 Tax=Romanomermis culicivorax TaxID=13658 RepID=A0A915KMT8_ROMCU
MSRIPPFLMCGRDYACSSNIKDATMGAGIEGYEFITASPAHPRCCFPERNLLSGDSYNEIFERGILPPLTFTKFDFGKKTWYKYVYAKASPWIDCDSEHPILRSTSIKDELSYFTDLQCPTILIECRSDNCVQMARIIKNYLDTDKSSANVWILIPVHQRSKNHLEEKDSWHWFYRIRVICNYSSRLGVALKFDRSTTSLSSNSTTIDRWFGEPIKCLMYDADIFKTSVENKPILPIELEKIASRFFHLPNIYALIYGGGEKLKFETVPKEFAPYISYLDAIYQESRKKVTEQEYCPGDVLYAPAAPLTETLSYSTYEEYETDRVKYDSYYKAIRSSLSRLTYCSSDATFRRKDRIIMVLGAGRGPLVAACLKAIRDVGLKVKVYAVEKNPNAVILLKHLVNTEWKGKGVEIVHSYMKDFRPADHEKADIIVSELLGSFGDNELSPECLNDAIHLSKDQCTYIPHSYTSFLAPVHSYKLRTAVNGLVDATQNPTQHIIKYSIVAIEPSKVTPGMFSWSPLFFPFSNPIYVEKGAEILVDFWRRSNSTKVWYEWCMNSKYRMIEYEHTIVRKYQKHIINQALTIRSVGKRQYKRPSIVSHVTMHSYTHFLVSKFREPQIDSKIVRFIHEKYEILKGRCRRLNISSSMLMWADHAPKFVVKLIKYEGDLERNRL